MNECVHIPLAKETSNDRQRTCIYITHLHIWVLSFDSADSSPNFRLSLVKNKRKFFSSYCSYA